MRSQATPASLLTIDTRSQVSRSGSSSGGAGGVAARVLSQLLHEMDGLDPLRKVSVRGLPGGVVHSHRSVACMRDRL